MSITKRTLYYAHLFNKIGLLTDEQKKQLEKSLQKNKNSISLYKGVSEFYPFVISVERVSSLNSQRP
ncbi:hypothetical protein [Halalkalibacter okhensis]|uniref:Uncharacterized protein n=1 Tax=Halalkalibacter okhensis TaxID=333138 RepID=A0A0B0IHX4_9BACI|nr:hypothetical protein [Halalkalibacter okhensis]KHF40467.1 hypothetical protein LQ50_09360 [Halalkalibacter okhensis]